MLSLKNCISDCKHPFPKEVRPRPLPWGRTLRKVSAITLLFRKITRMMPQIALHIGENRKKLPPMPQKAPQNIRQVYVTFHQRTNSIFLLFYSSFSAGLYVKYILPLFLSARKTLVGLQKAMFSSSPTSPVNLKNTANSVSFVSIS